jgi:hypothetical protein
MNIRILASLVGEDALGSYQYGKGDHQGVPDERAVRLIRSGRAVPIHEPKIETAELPRPTVEKRKRKQ